MTSCLLSCRMEAVAQQHLRNFQLIAKASTPMGLTHIVHSYHCYSQNGIKTQNRAANWREIIEMCLIVLSEGIYVYLPMTKANFHPWLWLSQVILSHPFGYAAICLDCCGTSQDAMGSSALFSLHYQRIHVQYMLLLLLLAWCFSVSYCQYNGTHLWGRWLLWLWFWTCFLVGYSSPPLLPGALCMLRTELKGRFDVIFYEMALH